MTATARTSATRFFWGFLIGSASVSVLGTVTHAVLGNAPSPVIAAAVAFFTVLIQLGATYGVHALVHARVIGAAYHWALLGVVTLALGAFIVNFVQLRDLVITWAAIAPAIAWIVPLIVDLGMTVSTVAIMALTSAARTEMLDMHDAAQPVAQPVAQATSAVHLEVHNTVRTDVQPAHDSAHAVTAERIVAAGVVRIAPDRVAQVLAAHAEGVKPSAIQRSLGVGYSTVLRIIEHQAAA
jgi:hypothetical protein